MNLLSFVWTLVIFEPLWLLYLNLAERPLATHHQLKEEAL